jgi:NitT/TauT family transport system substrate-binding protein
MRRSGLVFALLAALTGIGAARAEVSELRIAQQYGTSSLPLFVMQKNALIEKHARQAGLGDIRVEWSKFAGPSGMNEALLSGNLDISANGAPALLLLWDKTHGSSREIRGLASISSNPSTLVTRNPAVKTIRDLGEADRIALPAVKIGLNAIILQMAAAEAFGPDQWARLDPLTVTMAHPDALAAMISGKSEITGHFSQPPFATEEVKHGGRAILSASQVLGAGWDFILCATTRFHDANPRVTAAFLAALREAVDAINRDKRAAAATYLELSSDKKSSVEDILALIEYPETEYTLTPKSVMRFGTFMRRIGTLKTLPDSWKGLFFPEIHDLPGG